jgi:hypothetical protein
MLRSVIILFFVLPPMIHCSVLFTSVLLMDASSFSLRNFSSLVLQITKATSLTLHSVEPDTITGVQGKILFVNSSIPFYNFQLLHITRVLASVETFDEKTVEVIIRLSLSHEALLHGMGIMGIEDIGIGEADANQWLTTTYLELPPFVAQYLILGWAFTIISFCACVMCYCCCCRGGNTIPAATVLTSITTVPIALSKPSSNPVSVAPPLSHQSIIKPSTVPRPTAPPVIAQQAAPPIITPQATRPTPTRPSIPHPPMQPLARHMSKGDFADMLHRAQKSSARKLLGLPK